MEQHLISDISKLQITGDNDEEVPKLYMFINNGPVLKLSESGSISEYKEVGRTVAKVAGVEFWDKRPLHDELLWGKTQSSINDISALNSHLGDYN